MSRCEIYLFIQIQIIEGKFQELKLLLECTDEIVHL